MDANERVEKYAKAICNVPSNWSVERQFQLMGYAAMALADEEIRQAKAEVLRGFATGLMNALAADVRDNPAPSPEIQSSRDAIVGVARMARWNADDIEAEGD